MALTTAETQFFDRWFQKLLSLTGDRPESLSSSSFGSLMAQISSVGNFSFSGNNEIVPAGAHIDTGVGGGAIGIGDQNATSITIGGQGGGSQIVVNAQGNLNLSTPNALHMFAVGGVLALDGGTGIYMSGGSINLAKGVVATSGAPLVNSTPLNFIPRYWNGSADTAWPCVVDFLMNNTGPYGSLRIAYGNGNIVYLNSDGSAQFNALQFIGDGTAASPALRFGSETTNGIMRWAAGQLAVVSDGTGANASIFGYNSSGSLYLTKGLKTTYVETPGGTLQLFTNGATLLVGGGLFSATANGTVANTTAETSIVGAGQGSMTIPANFWTVGKAIRLTINGLYGNQATPGTLTIKIKIGSVVLASAALTLSASAQTNQAFEISVLLTCRTTGAAGTIMTTGKIEYEAGSTARSNGDLYNGGTASTVNTTVSGLLDCTATWGTASATNTISGVNVLAEMLQ